MTTNNLWKDDKVQFARLISEMESIGMFGAKAYHQLSKAMDLEPDYISELIHRAQLVFQASASQVLKRK